MSKKVEESAMVNSPAPISVAILAVPEATASTIYGMYEMLGLGSELGLLGESRFAPRVVALGGRTPITLCSGVVLTPDLCLADCPTPDVVIIPSLLVPPSLETLSDCFVPEIDWLRGCHAHGSIIATVCSGGILLAETGVLDGYQATTHWAYCDAMQRRYPRVQVQPQRAVVVTGDQQRILMAGGGTTWLDMALFLIARLVNVDAAMRVARFQLIDWHEIGQQPFASLARSRQQADALIGDVQAWIGENYAVHSPVAAMTHRSGLPDRSFVRRFKQATGLSPLEYVHTLRLEEAKQMLEATPSPVEAIANECGYEDAGYFGRLFSKHVGLTPAQYRRRFGSIRRALAS